MSASARGFSAGCEVTRFSEGVRLAVRIFAEKKPQGASSAVSSDP